MFRAYQTIRSLKTVIWLPAILCACLIAPVTVFAQGSFVVRDMRVEGLRRISEGTVFNYLPINVGDTIDAVRIQEAIRALYDQSLFDDVEMRREEDTLIVVVKERPSIENFTIEGNKDIKTEDLMESLRGVGLARGRTFDRSVLDNVYAYSNSIVWALQHGGIDDDAILATIVVLIAQKTRDFFEHRMVKRPAFGQPDAAQGLSQVLRLDVLVALDRETLDGRTFMHCDDQRVAIAAHFDVVKQTLCVQGTYRLLNTDLIDSVTNIDRQIVEHRTF